ncbi:hypothetical protein CAPTEDRAFT_217645 [Capitella teleta]|uniref:Uncharacterized protein n=1 Tax=Capitella teleta TaxID=283909 RepID=X2AMH6_CAPTE|nr:hypothetical protein CAPTEDRAFT_217645 [Capitella teleta]|eukprot:ELU00262.1 hypothetical protein CAPTEDRAFT_217645 [Capitella teleta]
MKSTSNELSEATRRRKLGRSMTPTASPGYVAAAPYPALAPAHDVHPKFDPRISSYDSIPVGIPKGHIVTITREHHGTMYYDRGECDNYELLRCKPSSDHMIGSILNCSTPNLQC